MANSSSSQNSTIDNSSATPEQIVSMGFYGTIEFQTIIVVLLTVVIVFGFLGNLTLIGTIFQRQRVLKTSSNYLIMNIAIADLLVAVVVAPLRLVEMFHGWPLGAFLCRFLAPIQDVIVCVSVVTHTVIALERYRGIVQPFKEKLSIRRTKQAIGIIWFACYLVIGLPIALNVQEFVWHGGVVQCYVKWSSDIIPQLYMVYLAVFFVIVPLTIQTYAYSCIVKIVNVEVKASMEDSTAIQLNTSDSGTTDTRATSKIAQSRVRVVKTLILLVVAFHVCSIPRVLTMLLWEFEVVSRNNLSFQYGSAITMIIYYLKHVINPFIIFATSAEFRGSCGFCVKCT